MLFTGVSKRAALLVVVSALVATLVVASPAAAAGSRQLSFGDAPAGWSVTSGEADANIGEIAATGVRKNRIRYRLEGAAGFSIKPRRGVVSYDGTAIDADQVLLTVTARDRKGKHADASVTISVTVTAAEPEPQTQQPATQQPETATDGQQRLEAQGPPEGTVEGTDIPAQRPRSYWEAGASAPFYTETDGFRHLYYDHDKDSSTSSPTPLVILLSYDTTGLSDAQKNAIQWLALHYRDTEHPYDGAISNWVRTLKQGVETRREALKDARHVKVQWYDCNLGGADYSVTMITSVGTMVDTVDNW